MAKVYEHMLDKTACDHCGRKVAAPVYSKVKNGWLIFFFCGEKCQKLFFEVNDEKSVILHWR